MVNRRTLAMWWCNRLEREQSQESNFKRLRKFVVSILNFRSDSLFYCPIRRSGRVRTRKSSRKRDKKERTTSGSQWKRPNPNSIASGHRSDGLPRNCHSTDRDHSSTTLGGRKATGNYSIAVQSSLRKGKNHVLFRMDRKCHFNWQWAGGMHDAKEDPADFEQSQRI